MNDYDKNGKQAKSAASNKRKHIQQEPLGWKQKQRKKNK